MNIVVSECDAATGQRKVSYVLNSRDACLTNNPQFPPPADAEIACEYAPSGTGAGIAGYLFCALGASICVVCVFLFERNINEAIIRKSQPIFVRIFLFGALLMNLSIIVLIGPGTNASCMARPWFICLSFTIMYAPLVMKLRRVEMLINNPKLKKIKITDYHVLAQVSAIIFVDILLLAIWSGVETPKLVDISKPFTATLAPVNLSVCSTSTGGLDGMEIAMIIWKVILLVYGVYRVRLYFLY